MELLTTYVDALKSGSGFKQLTEAQLQRLADNLPDEAIKSIPGKRGLNSVNMVYVYELYNEVFGVGGWAQVAQTSNKDNAALSKVEFLAFDYGIYRESYGGNNNDSGDLGDSYKGAVTDASTKIASMISSGVMKVWKNHYSPNNKPQETPKAWVNKVGVTDPNYVIAKAAIEKGEIKTEAELLAKFAFNSNTPTAVTAKTNLLSLLNK